MKIVVCVKQVPDTTEIKIDPVTNNLVREGIPSIMNPYDLSALRLALKLKEQFQALVTAVSMGPPQAVSVLEQALAMGADEAFLLTGREFAGADTLATGYALSAFLRSLQPDMVLCGNEAIDGCTGQVGPIIAENLGWPQITYVSSLELIDGVVCAEREMQDSYHQLQVKLPAVVCVLKDNNEQQINSNHELKEVGEVSVISTESLEIDTSRIGATGSPTRVHNISINNRKPQYYVEIDSNLPVKERIKLIINGGIIPKKITLTRGTPEHLAKVIFGDADFYKHLQ